MRRDAARRFPSWPRSPPNTSPCAQAEEQLRACAADPGGGPGLLRPQQGHLRCRRQHRTGFAHGGRPGADREDQCADLRAPACRRRRTALVLLVGQPLPADLPAPRSFNDTNLLAEIPAGLPSELLQRRPDILEAEHTLEGREREHRRGPRRVLSRPSPSPPRSARPVRSLSKLFGSGTGVWSFSPQVTVPIFTGGQNLANLDVGESEHAHRSRQLSRKPSRPPSAKWRTRWWPASSYASQIEAEAALINAQQRRYDLANLRYRQGEDTYLNVLSAQQDLYSAQQGRSSAIQQTRQPDLALQGAGRRLEMNQLQSKCMNDQKLLPPSAGYCSRPRCWRLAPVANHRRRRASNTKPRPVARGDIVQHVTASGTLERRGQRGCGQPGFRQNLRACTPTSIRR